VTFRMLKLILQEVQSWPCSWTCVMEAQGITITMIDWG